MTLKDKEIVNAVRNLVDEILALFGEAGIKGLEYLEVAEEKIAKLEKSLLEAKATKKAENGAVVLEKEGMRAESIKEAEARLAELRKEAAEAVELLVIIEEQEAKGLAEAKRVKKSKLDTKLPAKNYTNEDIEEIDVINNYTSNKIISTANEGDYRAKKNHLRLAIK